MPEKDLHWLAIEELAQSIHEWQWDACRIESPSKHGITPAWDTLDGRQVRILRSLARIVLEHFRNVETEAQHETAKEILEYLNTLWATDGDFSSSLRNCITTWLSSKYLHPTEDSTNKGAA